ncbi:MAG: multiheme c-type cytochrome [Planctomycetota bacterium]
MMARRGGNWVLPSYLGFFALLAAAALSALGYSAAGDEGSARPEPANVEQENAARPIQAPGGGYVTSENCRACHVYEYDTWHASHHRTMTQTPTRESVIADFDNKVIVRDGREFRFYHEGDDYFMRVTAGRAAGDRSSPADTPRPSKTFKVALSTGAHHQQAFWCETGQGRTVATLPFIWINKEQRWVPYRSIFVGAPSSAGLSMHGGLWNRTCIKCHVVGGRPRLGAEHGVDSRVAEFGISCEACHGPGLAHATAEGERLDPDFYGVPDPDAPIANPAKMTHVRSSQVCGQCHAVFDFYNAEDKRDFDENGFAYRPGGDLTATRHVFRVGEDQDLPVVKQALKRDPGFYDRRFWVDGMARVSGREYNGLLETPCYQRGAMSCLSCHDMHPGKGDHASQEQWADDQMGPDMRSNRACLQCHEEYESEDRLAAHTHHPTDSAGSLCYNCHMPHTTLGLMKAMRSHTVDSPDVATTVATGRPNACNLCHLDKTLAWTADYLEQWYETPAPELSRQQREVASSVRWVLQGDAGQRAIAGWHYGWGPAREASGTRWMAPYLAELLTDPYDVVRFIGYHSLKESPEFSGVDYDFVGSKRSQASVRDAVRRRWSESPQRPPTAQALLIDDRQGLDETRFEALRNKRRDPPIFLFE